MPTCVKNNHSFVYFTVVNSFHSVKYGVQKEISQIWKKKKKTNCWFNQCLHSLMEPQKRQLENDLKCWIYSIHCALLRESVNRLYNSLTKISSSFPQAEVIHAELKRIFVMMSCGGEMALTNYHFNCKTALLLVCITLSFPSVKVK